MKLCRFSNSYKRWNYTSVQRCNVCVKCSHGCDVTRSLHKFPAQSHIAYVSLNYITGVFVLRHFKKRLKQKRFSDDQELPEHTRNIKAKQNFTISFLIQTAVTIPVTLKTVKRSLDMKKYFIGH